MGACDSILQLRAHSPPMTFPKLPLCAEPDGRPTEDEAAFLQSIQGGVLKGHGRNHQRLVFFRFRGSPTQEGFRARAVQFLIHCGGWVTSAERQREQRELWKEAWPAVSASGDELLVQANHQLFCNLWLTRAGLDVLGLKMDAATDPDEPFSKGLKKRLGIEAREDEMGAPPYNFEGTDHDFHGILLLAGNQRDVLRDASREIFQGTEAEVLEQVDEITAWRDRSNPYDTDYLPPREPFGFADGISEPLFFHDERIPPAGGRPPEPTAW
jgi:deferrochelatase/peroxidase EfeB